MIDISSEVAQIAVALIAAVAAIVAAIVTAIIAPRLNSIRKDTLATRVQVENDHPRNLREELDERHEETRGWFRTLYRIVAGLAVAVAGLVGAVTLNHTRLVRVETHMRGRRT